MQVGLARICAVLDAMRRKVLFYKRNTRPMTCPICNSPARSITAITQGAVALSCPSCGDWEASPLANETLEGFPPHQRLQALRFAQTNAMMGRRPLIRGL